MSIFFCKPPLHYTKCITETLASEVARIGKRVYCVTYGNDTLSSFLQTWLPDRYNQKIETRLMIPFLCRNWLNQVSQGDLAWIYTNGVIVNPIADATIENIIKKKGGRYVFQLIDAWPMLDSNLKPACERRVNLADLTVAVTPQLTELLQHTYPGINCTTAEEAVDTDSIRPVDLSHHTGKKILLWSGPPGKKDLLHLKDILASVYRRIPFLLRVVSGYKNPDYDFPFPWEWLPFNITTPNEASAGASAAIAYYGNSPYERCKGNYKVKKYMAAGIPVVTSDVGYNRVLIQNGINGLLTPNEPEAWEQALLQVLSNPKDSIRLGSQARKDTVARYSYASIAKKYLEILEKYFPETLN